MSASRKKKAPPGLVSAHFEVGGEAFVVFRVPATPSSARAQLSAAEVHVLDLIVAGRSNAEIAAERKTSARTVANQVASLLKKLGVGSRYELARLDRDSHLNVHAPPRPRE